MHVRTMSAAPPPVSAVDHVLTVLQLSAEVAAFVVALVALVIYPRETRGAYYIDNEQLIPPVVLSGVTVLFVAAAYTAALLQRPKARQYLNAIGWYLLLLLLGVTFPGTGLMLAWNKHPAVTYRHSLGVPNFVLAVPYVLSSLSLVAVALAAVRHLNVFFGGLVAPTKKMADVHITLGWVYLVALVLMVLFDTAITAMSFTAGAHQKGNVQFSFDGPTNSTEAAAFDALSYGNERPAMYITGIISLGALVMWGSLLTIVLVYLSSKKNPPTMWAVKSSAIVIMMASAFQFVLVGFIMPGSSVIYGPRSQYTSLKDRWQNMSSSFQSQDALAVAIIVLLLIAASVSLFLHAACANVMNILVDRSVFVGARP